MCKKGRGVSAVVSEAYTAQIVKILKNIVLGKLRYSAFM